MKLSYVIVTHDRRERLLETLAHLHRTTPLPADQWETWIVDNASTDGTAEAVAERFPSVRVLRRSRNEGVGARTHAFERAAGTYLVLLDDDSYPTGDTVTRSLTYLDAHPRTAALVGRVQLPDGGLEACAMPTVMLSGAVCLRRDAAVEVGGFRREFFRKAGEYDFSFRLWSAGYAVERFEDLTYRHDKVHGGRSAALAHRMDLRNNAILAERFLPGPWRTAYREDWTRRYTALARHAGHGRAALRARIEAHAWAVREACTGRLTLDDETFERVFEVEAQARAVSEWSHRHRVRRVVIADLSKNLYTTWRACMNAGLRVTAIADDHRAFRGLRYRGLHVVSDRDALADAPDGVVVSNVNPARVDDRVETLRQRFDGPLLRLWHPRTLAPSSPPFESPVRASAGVVPCEV